jgi:hypothetical protein
VNTNPIEGTFLEAERLELLDHKGRLGLCPTGAHRQHIGEATTPGAAGRISHFGHPLAL